MKFLIIGDSWGIGEYAIIKQLMTPVPHTGIDHYLQYHGHKVENISAGSASNFGQLRHCRTVLEQSDSVPDYIIWFHTEPVRDIADTVIDDELDGPIQFPLINNYNDFDQAMQYMNYQNYVFAQTIYDQFQCPFIVVGGLGKLHSCIESFSFASYKIYSWAQEMLNLTDLPDNIFSRNREKEIVNQFKFTKDSIINAIDSSKRYQELLNNSTKFPDGLHPARSEYEILCHRILTCLT